MGVIKRRSGWCGSGDRDGVLVLSQYPTLPSGAISQDWALLFLQHQLGACTNPVLQLLAIPPCPAQVQQGPVVCSFSGRTIGRHSRQSSKCVALEQRPIFPPSHGFSSTTPYGRLSFPNSWWPHPAELSYGEGWGTRCFSDVGPSKCYSSDSAAEELSEGMKAVPLL